MREQAEELRVALSREWFLWWIDAVLFALRVVVVVTALGAAFLYAWWDAKQLLRLRVLFLSFRFLENLGWVAILSVVLLPLGLGFVLGSQLVLVQIYQASNLRGEASWRPTLLGNWRPQ